MEVEELRIGNLVKYKDDIINISIEDFGMLDCGINIIEDYKPIKLNEKWLIEFGAYEVNRISEYFEGEYMSIYQLKIKGIPGFFSSCGLCNNYEHIIYIHQLQNIFQALTGEELKIYTEKTDLLK